MMVVILKENPDSGRISDLTAWLESLGLEVHPTVGKVQTILGLVGDTSKVESEEQVCEIARAVKASGATMLRGGAFKPRTSP